MSKRILVVEDEPVIMTVLESRLKANGFTVVTAIDGQDALNKARTESPDLIILDVMLPKLDGFRVCRLLKFDDSYKHIPIIMLTARIQESDKQTGEQVGANAYLPKPFDPQTLLKTIRTLLEEAAAKKEEAS